jgi:hypothetical protein
VPALDLFMEPIRMAGATQAGNLPLNPSAWPLRRVPLRRLSCTLRVPPIPGAQRAFIDTGAALSQFPHHVWANQFNWRAGRDYDELTVTGNPPLRGQTLGFNYAFRLVRLRVPVFLGGRDLAGPRLQVDSLVTQLAEPGGPPFVLLGLWGGVLDGRRLGFGAASDGDPTAALEF